MASLKVTLVLVVQVLQFILTLFQAHPSYSNVQYLLDLLVTMVNLPAIDLALEFCQSYFTSHPEVNKIIILSNCQSAITTVSGFQHSSNFVKIICKIYDRIKQLSEILWIAAHTGIIENELADQCAKEAAKEAAELDFDGSLPLSFTGIKKEIKKTIPS